jgi:hypothetical protein
MQLTEYILTVCENSRNLWRNALEKRDLYLGYNLPWRTANNVICAYDLSRTPTEVGPSHVLYQSQFVTFFISSRFT